MTLQKVVWAEGMVLGQQHFQAWDKYVENTQQLFSQAAAPLGWGLMHLEVETEALRSGVFRLKRCTAVLPCGNLVQYDVSNSASLSCDLQEDNGSDIEIFLGLPSGSAVSGINGYTTSGQLCRWEADYQNVPDQHDSSREREILLARHNLTLFKGEISGDQFSVIKIAELTSNGAGGYALSEEFIPTVCRVGASEVLLGRIKRLSELVSAKAKVLKDRMRQYGDNIAEYGPNELSSFLLLQALNPAAAQLKHSVVNMDMHPENLYRILIDVASVMQCYKADSELYDFPAYEHNDPSKFFIHLDTLIRGLIDEVMPSKTTGLKLQRESEFLYSVDSIDIILLEKSSFYLAVSMNNEDVTWFQELPRKVKVGARVDIDMIIASAMPGVQLVHTQRPPNRLPIKSGYEYFRVEQNGEFWNRVIEERSLALFLTKGFGSAIAELVTIVE